MLDTSYLILRSVAIFDTSNIVDKSLLKRDTVLMTRDIDPPICSYDRANKLSKYSISYNNTRVLKKKSRVVDTRNKIFSITSVFIIETHTEGRKNVRGVSSIQNINLR